MRRDAELRAFVHELPPEHRVQEVTQNAAVREALARFPASDPFSVQARELIRIERERADPAAVRAVVAQKAAIQSVEAICNAVRAMIESEVGKQRLPLDALLVDVGASK